MTDQLFDNFIRDKLRDHVSAVPDDMWKRIEREKDKPPQAHPASPALPRLYWWLGTLLLVACGSAFWLLQPAGSRQGTPQNNLVHSKTVLSDTISTPSSVTGLQPAPSAPSALPAQADSVPAPGSSDLTFTTGIGHTFRDNGNTAGQGNRDNYSADHGSLSAGGNYRSSNGQLATTAIAPVNGSAASELPAQAPFATLDNYEPEKLFQLTPTGYFSLKSLLNKQGYKKLPVIQCPTLGPLRNDLYLEVYASPDYVMRSITATDPHNNSYLQHRDSSENMQVSFSLGARLTKSLGDHLLAKLGLQYTQVNQKFSYLQENERRQVTVVTTHIIVQSPGDTVIVHDTSSYEQIGYLKKSTINKFKSIDIPILLSYEWGNDQWKFAANAGPVINLYSWYSGQMFDTSLQPVSINGKNSNAVYKRNIGLGVYAGVSIIKSVSENMELFAEPYFRYNFSNMAQPGQPFTQKFKTAGLSLGIRYKLNGSGQRSWRR